MATDPNKLSQFWQELKRRRVIHVIIVYATASFVIIELVGNVYESLQLPDWTPALILVILGIGFPLAIIFSWIFDVTPKGIEKTEPLKEANKKGESITPNSWKIASYLSFVVIIVLIILQIIPHSGRSAEKAILDKSIAVLPFINDSPTEEKMYFINGTMESILDNLCKIHDLKVVSRTSVEQYRNNLKPVQEIAKEMNVSYILEGSGMKDGENIRLTIQLIDAINDRHIWSDSYHRKTDEIFSLQSEIAQLVAGEIEAIISPEEKQLIDKIPTTSLTAYDLYQQGREAERTYSSGFGQEEAALRAESLYRRSLQHDSTFAQAYLRLASIFFLRLTKANNPNLPDENLLDSGLFYLNTALSYDDQLADAYIIKGMYHSRFRESKQALKMWEKAISINPNAAGPYVGMGWLYFMEGDYVKSITNFVKATSLDRGPDLPLNLKHFGFALTSIGFFTEAKQAYLEALNLDGDSSSYYLRLSYVEYCAANYEKAIEASHNARSSGSKDPESWSIIGCSYLYLGQYEEALDYLQKFTEELESLGQANPYNLPWVAYAYLQNGYTEESEKYVSEQINMAEEWFRNRISGMEENYLRLAFVYAVMGENDKAYENLSLYRETGHTSVYVVRSRNVPMFEKIRDKPEFDQIMTDLEAKYQEEHERVRQWLEENDML